MVLYIFGVALNLFIYVVRKLSLPDEPGFFTGYGKLEAILLVFLNDSRRDADAIVKGLAT
ncbi:hypothetical protein JCM10295v2_006627 [Rhodotorula toruloides]